MAICLLSPSLGWATPKKFDHVRHPCGRKNLLVLFVIMIGLAIVF